MDRIFDPEKPIIGQGFGLTVEESEALIAEYLLEGSSGDIIDRLCNNEDLPPNKRYFLLIALGANMVAVTIEEMRKPLLTK